ncbi:MAG TPA: hypothetical protein VF665_23595 [Longimicrobium sp.]|jgi:hypothetical protein|uniref:hypothetical protein n=1 Tax=Longimicrobium sp. TaxID=2029185 RepID=UPI002EDB4780
MPYLQDSVGRHARDRGEHAPRTRLGPYEAAYDVRMGYQEPADPAPRTPSPEPLLFRGRGDRPSR